MSVNNKDTYSRYALRLPNKKWVSINKDKGEMLYQSKSVRGKKYLPPPHYMTGNIFKVLRVRRRVLEGEPVYVMECPGVFIPKIFNECVCVRIDIEC